MLSVKQVAERLNLSERSILNLIKEGRLPAFRIGGVYRIEESDLNTFINSSKINEEKEIKK